MSDFDFNMDLATVPERLRGEREARLKLASRALSFNVSFLDDCCRAILPHDLILIGARTGAGKTTIASIIAQTNALQGKRVHYFALEAEPLEIERWLKYRWISKRAHEKRVDRAVGLNYPDWYLGRCDEETAALDEEVDKLLAEKFKTLTTYYRGKEFSIIDLERLFLAIQDQTDLIILDHLHYIDSDDPNENRAQKATTKAIRNLSILMGIPIIVVAHLRKRESRKVLLPELEDFHGSSDITKIATRAILLAPAWDMEGEPGRSPTYVTVAKDRLGGATRTTAVLNFNLATGQYCERYQLGRMDASGEKWARIELEKCPRWARRAA